MAINRVLYLIPVIVTLIFLILDVIFAIIRVKPEIDGIIPVIASVTLYQCFRIL